jgi:hypothetical protein
MKNHRRQQTMQQNLTKQTKRRQIIDRLRPLTGEDHAGELREIMVFAIEGTRRRGISFVTSEGTLTVETSTSTLELLGRKLSMVGKKSMRLKLGMD